MRRTGRICNGSRKVPGFIVSAALKERVARSALLLIVTLVELLLLEKAGLNPELKRVQARYYELYRHPLF